MSVTLDDLRRFAVTRSLRAPTTLGNALESLGFVQADPIRAPARAQDLTLRHRVRSYRAGDLERLYPTLPLEEDVFVNYGYVTDRVHALMHPRAGASRMSKRKRAILDFVLARGTVHPRDVDAHFDHGKVTNYWGGVSNATTRLLETMHYEGLLRIVRRDRGVRIYSVQAPRPAPADRRERLARIDALVDVAVRKYAPLSAASLSTLVSRLRYAVPQWQRELKSALDRARKRLAHSRVDGIEWFWPAEETPQHHEPLEIARFLAPFDPVVWDRRRFELLWRWPYRFEAYTPVKRRRFGYYAMPLLWREHVIGWANVTTTHDAVDARIGFVDPSRARERALTSALEAERERLRAFLFRSPHARAGRPAE